MAKKRAFISFDYEHDQDLKNLLVGQSRHPDTDFEIVDMSIKEAIATNWRDHARTRIKGCDIVIVICGEHTCNAMGVSAEINMAREESVPYFLLYGRADKNCTKPPAALSGDKMYRWSWDNLKALVNGSR